MPCQKGTQPCEQLKPIWRRGHGRRRCRGSSHMGIAGNPSASAARRHFAQDQRDEALSVEETMFNVGIAERVEPTSVAVGAPTLDAEAIMQRRARSFSLAVRFLPAAQRRPTTVLYAFFRTLDDLVDEPPAGWSREQ